MIDTHAHLDACPDPPEELVRRARDAGVQRILTVGTTIERGRTALALADAHDEVFAIVGIHPHEAGSADGVDGLRELLAHERAVGVGETGLDFYRDYAPRDRQRALFAEHLELARELGKPVVIHNRAADDEVLAQLGSLRRRRRPPLLLVPGRARGRARARLLRLVRGQRHLQERVGAPRRRLAGAARTDPRGNRLPVPLAEPRRGRPNEPDGTGLRYLTDYRTADQRSLCRLLLAKRQVDRVPARRAGTWQS